MSRRSLVTMAAVCLVSSSLTASSAFADEDIDNPTCTSPYLYTSNIAANGSGQSGMQYTVKLLKEGSIENEETVTASNGQWSYTFNAPSGGWTCGVNYTIELWRDGTKRATSCTFTFTGCGGAP